MAFPGPLPLHGPWVPLAPSRPSAPTPTPVLSTPPLRLPFVLGSVTHTRLLQPPTHILSTLQRHTSDFRWITHNASLLHPVISNGTRHARHHLLPGVQAHIASSEGWNLRAPAREETFSQCGHWTMCPRCAPPPADSPADAQCSSATIPPSLSCFESHCPHFLIRYYLLRACLVIGAGCCRG